MKKLAIEVTIPLSRAEKRLRKLYEKHSLDYGNVLNDLALTEAQFTRLMKGMDSSLYSILNTSYKLTEMFPLTSMDVWVEDFIEYQLNYFRKRKQEEWRSK